MNCPNCGAPIDPNDRFCGECGTDLTKSASTQTASTASHRQQPTQPKHTDHSNTVHNHTNTQSNQAYKQPDHAQSNQSYEQPSHTHSHPNHSNQQPSFDKEKFNQQANEIKNEGSNFFGKLFTSHDLTVSENKPFSLKFIGILSAIFLILTIIVLAILIPKEIEMFSLGISKAGIVTRIFFSILLFVVLGFITMAGVIRLVIKDKISFTKILSDYVFINTFSFIFFILGILLVALKIFSIGFFLTCIGIIAFYSAAVYILTKYSSYHALRIPVFFGILIYIVIQLIVLSIYGEMIRNTFINTFKSAIEDFNPFGGGF